MEICHLWESPRSESLSERLVRLSMAFLRCEYSSCSRTDSRMSATSSTMEASNVGIIAANLVAWGVILCTEKIASICTNQFWCSAHWKLVMLSIMRSCLLFHSKLLPFCLVVSTHFGGGGSPLVARSINVSIPQTYIKLQWLVGSCIVCWLELRHLLLGWPESIHRRLMLIRHCSICYDQREVRISRSPLSCLAAERLFVWHPNMPKCGTRPFNKKALCLIDIPIKRGVSGTRR